MNNKKDRNDISNCNSMKIKFQNNNLNDLSGKLYTESNEDKYLKKNKKENSNNFGSQFASSNRKVSVK